MKHTPGPWRFLEEGRTEEDGNRAHPLTICGGGSEDIANVYSQDDATVAIPREQAIANARLIAAALELLEALQALAVEYEPNLKTFAENAPRKAIWQQAIAAIAKATTEAPE